MSFYLSEAIIPALLVNNLTQVGGIFVGQQGCRFELGQDLKYLLANPIDPILLQSDGL